MEKYTNEGSSKIPMINFDLINGVLEIKGRSIPENPIDFYTPLLDALDLYSVSVKSTTLVNIELDYFNSSSAKCIFTVFKKLENIHKEGNVVIINWKYQEDDDEILEAGEDYHSLINIPFKMIRIAKKR